ncbi:50S ribosomal protein L18 [Candidatus Poribacteria bacterium]|nr:50S ribosomal protein L18 [Candidatus Poribacteria bacterium]
MHKNLKNVARKKRHIRVRKKISGVKDVPRLNVFRSMNHIYAQLIDDEARHVLTAASTVAADIKKDIKNGKNIAAAKIVGTAIAKKALEKGIKKVVFDKSGYQYHGRIKALAEAAREGGLEF